MELVNRTDILIYHVHTTESFTPCAEFSYEMTGNFRTIDLNYSIARVGREFAELLETRGFSVDHDTTIHDFPAFSGSYARGLETAQRRLNNTNTQIVIDMHRDAIGDGSFGPRVNIDGEYVAQLMFVIRYKSEVDCTTQIGGITYK